jgi:hypothetical protein
VEPADDKLGDELDPPASRIRRVRARAAVVHARAAERAQLERQRHPTVAAIFEMVDHDSEVGGGIMAGALAYRLFIWLLPLALVAVAGLGIAANASSRSPESEADSLGLAGLVSSSVAGAANSPARWYALLFGIPILVYTTRSVLRTLIVVHRLVWTDARAAVPKPTAAATLRLLAFLLGLLVVSTAASAARALSGGAGVLAALLIPVPYAALWLLISMRLPHRDAPWRALVPGALLLGVGSRGAARRCRVRDCAVREQQAGHVRLARDCRSPPPRPVLDQPPCRRERCAQRDAVATATSNQAVTDS